MSLIALSTIRPSLIGYLALNAVEGTDYFNIRRRVTKIKTLGGGAVLSDLGVASSDVDIEIHVNSVKPAELDQLKRLVKTEPLLGLSCSEGHFIGTISELNFKSVPLYFTFLVKEKRS